MENTSQYVNLCWKYICRISFLLSPVILCIFWQYFAGKDVNWDALNYHTYAGFGVFSDRLYQDFMPAGPQSYLNPLAYVPFFLLLKYVELPFLIASILAILHSLVIYLTYFIAKRLLQPASDTCVVLFISAFALLSNVYWHQVGSSFIDVYICIGILLGGYLYLRSADLNCGCCLYLSAFCFGFMGGLKLTSLIYSLAVGLICFYQYAVQKKQYVVSFTFGICVFLGFLLSAGWWAWLVYERFGNPFFPYFNDLFASDYYLSEAIINLRFIPESFFDALILPFSMIMPSPWLYQEILSPDVRLLAMFVIILITIARQPGLLSSSSFQIGFVFLFWLLSYSFWLFSAANGRYGMPLFILSGVISGVLLFKLFGEKRFYWYTGSLVVVQFSVLFLAADWRLDGRPWGKHFFNYDIPLELQEQPYLFLTVSKQSASFLAMKFHPDSSFVNVSGQTPLSTTKAYAELDRIAKALDNKVMLISGLSVLIDKPFPPQNWSVTASSILQRFGFRVNEDQCAYFGDNDIFRDKVRDYIAYCLLEYDVSLAYHFREESQVADAVFDKVEQFCPEYFNPSTNVTEKRGNLLQRYYVGSEITLSLWGDDVMLDSSTRAQPLVLGNAQEWIKEPSRMAGRCDQFWPKISDGL